MTRPTERIRLAPGVVPRRLVRPSLYHTATDELYELDDDAEVFLRRVVRTGVPVDALSAEERDVVREALAEGLLVVGPGDVGAGPSWPRRRAPDPALRYLEVQITNRCNLRCRHCYLGDAGTRDLEPDVFAALLEDFEALQGLRVLISGGEPLAHPAFDRINERLPAAGLRVVLLTNATRVTAELAAGLQVHEAQVSLDGLEAGHDALRGPGSFRKALAGARHLREAGIALSVATVIHRHNLAEFDGLERLVRELDAVEWSVDALCRVGRATSDGIAVADDLAAPLMERGFGGSLHGGDGPAELACGAHLMTVLPDGRAAKCGYYADRAVGYLDDGLAVLWSRVEKTPLSRLSCRCPKQADCRGGCRFRAEQAGDPLGPDPLKCRIYGQCAPRDDHADAAPPATEDF